MHANSMLNDEYYFYHPQFVVIFKREVEEIREFDVRLYEAIRPEVIRRLHHDGFGGAG